MSLATFRRVLAQWADAERAIQLIVDISGRRSGRGSRVRRKQVIKSM